MKKSIICYSEAEIEKIHSEIEHNLQVISFCLESISENNFSLNILRGASISHEILSHMQNISDFIQFQAGKIKNFVLINHRLMITFENKSNIISFN
jgi:hypothetical protein